MFGALATSALAACATTSAADGGRSTLVPLTTAFATLPPVTAPPTTQLGETTTLAPGQPTTYTVQNGDYLYGIAKSHGVSAEDIVTINGWDSVKHSLVPGQQILVPAPSAGSTASASSGTAAPPNATAPLPSGLVPDTTAPPASAAATTAASSGGGADTTAPAAGGATTPYTVKNGDTVYGIANKFKITPQALVAANGWSSVNHSLYPGDVISIPAAAG